MQVFLTFENIMADQLEDEISLRILSHKYHIDSLNVMPSAEAPLMFNAFVAFSADESNLIEADLNWVKMHTKVTKWTPRK